MSVGGFARGSRTTFFGFALGLISVAVLALPANAQSADIDEYGAFYVDPDRPKAIFLDGDIDDYAQLDFRRARRDYPSARLLVLNSDGGFIADALAIADEAFADGFSTLIPGWAGCYSACAYIFFAGVNRVAIGDLGVHQFSSDDPSPIDAQRSVADILDILGPFDIPDEVISAMLRTPPDDMYVFSNREIDNLAINRGAIAEASLYETVAIARAPSGPVPDWELAPFFGEVTLVTGYEDDPHVVELQSGGTIDAERAIGGDCAGFIAEAPDYRVYYTAGDRYPLIFSVESDEDTTLVISDPNADWVCDDDSGPGLNPEVFFNRPLSGQYDIWVGTYEGNYTADAALLISEIEGTDDEDDIVDIATYRDWFVTRGEVSCYAESDAQQSEPANRNYFTPLLWVEVDSEIGIIAPTFLFDYEPDNAYYVSAFIDGGRAFDFVPDGSIAVLHGRQEIAEFVAAMRRGVSMQVISVDPDGVDRTDSYSLLGFTAAINRATEECGG